MAEYLYGVNIWTSQPLARAAFDEIADLEEIPRAWTYGIRIEDAYAQRTRGEVPAQPIPDRTWSRLPAAAIDDRRLSVLDWRVLAFRALHPKAAHATIAGLLGVRRPKVSEAHQRLQQYGHLKAVHEIYETRDGRRLPKPRYRGDKSVFGSCEYKVLRTQQNWVRMPLAALQRLKLSKADVRMVAVIGQQVDDHGFAFVRPNMDKRRIGVTWEEYLRIIDYFVRVRLIEVVELSVREDPVTEEDRAERDERAWYRDEADADKLGVAVNYAPVNWK